jgi:hypothetical protein
MVKNWLSMQGSRGMQPPNREEATHPLTSKEWRRPVLQRLPISATAGGGGKTAFNEGGGQGKGDAGDQAS